MGAQPPAATERSMQASLLIVTRSRNAAFEINTNSKRGRLGRLPTKKGRGRAFAQPAADATSSRCSLEGGHRDKETFKAGQEFS